MSRLAKNVVLVSKPIRTFPNGDYFYVELSRKSTLYHCAVMMSCAGKPLESVVVAKSQGKTIREAEDAAYSRAIDRCPGFPRPPYLASPTQRDTSNARSRQGSQFTRNCR